MGATLGLPDGKRVRLQEALTWAMFGWSWSSSSVSLADLSNLQARDDYPAPGSISAQLEKIETWEATLDRDTALLNRFDRLLSQACFTGDVEMIGRRPSSTEFETIPFSFFFKPRGFDLSSSIIDSIPTGASFDEIIGDRSSERWEEVSVDRRQFVNWFNGSCDKILEKTKPVLAPEMTSISQPNSCQWTMLRERLGGRLEKNVWLAMDALWQRPPPDNLRLVTAEYEIDKWMAANKLQRPRDLSRTMRHIREKFDISAT